MVECVKSAAFQLKCSLNMLQARSLFLCGFFFRPGGAKKEPTKEKTPGLQHI